MKDGWCRKTLWWVALAFCLASYFWLPLLYVGLAILVVSWFL